MSTIYINTPFAPDEHDAIASMAKKEGRSKGQQLRLLALRALKTSSTPTPRRKRKEALNK